MIKKNPEELTDALTDAQFLIFVSSAMSTIAKELEANGKTELDEIPDAVALFQYSALRLNRISDTIRRVGDGRS